MQKTHCGIPTSINIYPLSRLCDVSGFESTYVYKLVEFEQPLLVCQAKHIFNTIYSRTRIRDSWLVVCCRCRWMCDDIIEIRKQSI